MFMMPLRDASPVGFLDFRRAFHRKRLTLNSVLSDVVRRCIFAHSHFAYYCIIPEKMPSHNCRLSVRISAVMDRAGYSKFHHG